MPFSKSNILSDDKFKFISFLSLNYNYTNNEKWWKKIKKTKLNQELVFIHTPKCGGTYASSIFKNLNINYKGHLRAKKNEGITFTIIRDPVERFESMLNYRLGRLVSQSRNDWPERLRYMYNDKTISLNEIISNMTDKEIISFTPYNTLSYWGYNIDIFISIDKLPSFLSYFGYNYYLENYPKLTVSKKERGKLNEKSKNRIARLYFDDMVLYKRTILNMH